MRYLVLCTGNRCRSQMAHGIIRHINPGSDVCSAGVRPASEVHPLAVKVMAEIGIDISSHYPKSINEYLDQSWDYVITVCGGAKENCPAFIGNVKNRIHIGFDDPDAFSGTEEQVIGEFRRVRDEILKAMSELFQDERPALNSHNKIEHPQAHSAEHLLNATMVKMFGCPRSRNAHVERKKSKCDYILDSEPTAEEVAQIEAKVNEAISLNMDVTVEFMPRERAAGTVDLSKLPEDASETLRIVRIGDYDTCACIGNHVQNTREIGTFRIISHSFADGVWRVRWKVN